MTFLIPRNQQLRSFIVFHIEMYINSLLMHRNERKTSTENIEKAKNK